MQQHALHLLALMAKLTKGQPEQRPAREKQIDGA